MNKCLVAIMLILGLTSCAKKNEHYYLSHPDKLQAAIKLCPEQQPKGLSCEQLQQIAGRMNNLAYQLQLSPQGFGNKILSLQEMIAKQQQQLKNEGINAELQAKIDQNQHDLSEHMAVVKWLESPAS